MTPNLSLFLNNSRWIAAFLVVIAHIRHLILVDYKDVVHKTTLVKGVYFITGLGHEAVVIFFVISGFLVGGGTLIKWQDKGPNPIAYACARFSRIYTVLIPALLAGFGLDWVGLHWFNASELYTNAAQYNMSVHPAISSDMTISTLVGNFFMMQHILVGTLGSNAPLWSLAYEWWYYCLFGLFAAAFTGAGNKRFFLALIGILIAMVLPPKLLLWGMVWLLGVLAYSWLQSPAWRPPAVIGMSIFAVAMVVSRLSHSSESTGNTESYVIEFGRDFILGVAYAVALVSASRLNRYLFWPRVNAALAEFSYSTYLIHFPALLFIVAVGYQQFGLRFQVQPDTHSMLYMMVLTAFTYLNCYAFAQLTERHTNLVRRKIDKGLKQLFPTRYANWIQNTL